MDKRIILYDSEIGSISPIALKLRCILIGLAQKDEDEINLPAQKYFEQFLKCNNRKYEAALQELEQLGYIHVSNPYNGGKKVRKRVVVRFRELKIVDDEKFKEMVEDYGKGTLHKIYSTTLQNCYSLLSHPKLNKLKKTELSTLSKDADPKEIEIALKEIIEYNKPINNIYALYRSRFNTKREKGVLNPHRTSKLFSFKKSKHENISKIKCRFYPMHDIGFDESEVDQLCSKLSEYIFIEEGAIPIQQLAANRGIFISHATEKKVTLSQNFELVKIKCGYWDIKAIQQKSTTTSTRLKKQPSLIGDAIKGLALSN